MFGFWLLGVLLNIGFLWFISKYERDIELLKTRRDKVITSLIILSSWLFWAFIILVILTGEDTRTW